MSNKLSASIRALRPHQWVKNILIFVPAILGMDLSANIIVSSLLAFISFSLAASSFYIVNDLVDIEADQAHPVKRSRPFAAAELSARWGAGLALFTFVVAVSIAVNINTPFLIILLAYSTLTAVYSLWLKRIVLLDVIALALLYTSRLIAGALAVQQTLSFWLIIFSLFIFTSLAMVKRYSELYNLKSRNKLSSTGRGYTVNDLALVMQLGVSSGLIAILVIALYIHDPVIMAKYSHYMWLWSIVPALLYWVGYIWVITSRGQMNEDPVLFASRNLNSYLVAAVCALALLLAIN